MSHSMRVVEISKSGGPSVLKLSTRDIPQPGYGEVLIKVAYAGVNRPDALQRAGLYNPPPTASDLPGLEASGTIEKIGPGVDQLREGDQVCALLPGGGYAEFAKTLAVHCLPVPEGLSLKEAACIPETYFTVWSNVFQRGGLDAGESFLVHGGSSGIGTTAIQLASVFGARVFTTAGSEKKCKACLDLGAEIAVNYNNDDFVDIICKLGGANVILDMVGGSYIPRNLKALADDGRLIQIAFLEGPKVEVNFTNLMIRRLTVTGSTLRPQSDHAKKKIAESLLEKVWPLLNQGRVRPVMDSTFALEDAAAAHTRLEKSLHIGKIVLETNKDGF